MAKKKALRDFNNDMSDLVSNFAHSYKVVLAVIPDKADCKTGAQGKRKELDSVDIFINSFI